MVKALLASACSLGSSPAYPNCPKRRLRTRTSPSKITSRHLSRQGLSIHSWVACNSAAYSRHEQRLSGPCQGTCRLQDSEPKLRSGYSSEKIDIRPLFKSLHCNLHPIGIALAAITHLISRPTKKCRTCAPVLGLKFICRPLQHPSLTGRSSGRQHRPCLRHFHGLCWCPTHLRCSGAAYLGS
jgi:hypothetical protein